LLAGCWEQPIKRPYPNCPWRAIASPLAPFRLRKGAAPVWTYDKVTPAHSGVHTAPMLGWIAAFPVYTRAGAGMTREHHQRLKFTASFRIVTLSLAISMGLWYSVDTYHLLWVIPMLATRYSTIRGRMRGSGSTWVFPILFISLDPNTRFLGYATELKP